MAPISTKKKRYRQKAFTARLELICTLGGIVRTARSLAKDAEAAQDLVRKLHEAEDSHARTQQ